MPVPGTHLIDAELISSGKHQFSAPFAQLKYLAAKLFWQQDFPHDLLIARGIHYRSVAADDRRADKPIGEEVHDLRVLPPAGDREQTSLCNKALQRTEVLFRHDRPAAPFGESRAVHIGVNYQFISFHTTIIIWSVSFCPVQALDRICQFFTIVGFDMDMRSLTLL